MKNRLLCISFCLLTILMVSTFAVLPMHAQGLLPATSQQENISTEATPLLIPGEFTAYFEDRYHSRTSIIYDTYDFYLVIETQPGWANIYASCVTFYPNYVQSTIFSNKFLGSSGVFRNGPYHFEPGDPEGQYTFRVTIRYIDTGGTPRESQNAAILQFNRTRSYPYPYPQPYPYPSPNPTPYPHSYPYPTPQAFYSPYPSTPPSIVSFLASPTTIRTSETAMLTWNVADATTITIEPGIGTVQSTGTVTITPVATTTYTLTASNNAGVVTTGTASILVEPVPAVTLPAPSPQPTPLPTATLTPLPTNGNTWFIYLLIAVLVVIIAIVLIIVLLYRRPSATTVPPPTPKPITPISLPQGKLILPDNSELSMSGTTMPLGRNNFSNTLSRDQLSYISRQHFQLSYENGRYYIEDMRSMNGTRVNGAEIRGAGRHELRNGDSIEMGNVARLVFRTS